MTPSFIHGDLDEIPTGDHPEWVHPSELRWKDCYRALQLHESTKGKRGEEIGAKSLAFGQEIHIQARHGLERNYGKNRLSSLLNLLDLCDISPASYLETTELVYIEPHLLHDVGGPIVRGTPDLVIVRSTSIPDPREIMESEGRYERYYFALVVELKTGHKTLGDIYQTQTYMQMVERWLQRKLRVSHHTFVAVTGGIIIDNFRNFFDARLSNIHRVPFPCPAPTYVSDYDRLKKRAALDDRVYPLGPAQPPPLDLCMFCPAPAFPCAHIWSLLSTNFEQPAPEGLVDNYLLLQKLSSLTSGAAAKLGGPTTIGEVAAQNHTHQFVWEGRQTLKPPLSTAAWIEQTRSLDIPLEDALAALPASSFKLKKLFKKYPQMEVWFNDRATSSTTLRFRARTPKYNRTPNLDAQTPTLAPQEDL